MVGRYIFSLLSLSQFSVPLNIYYRAYFSNIGSYYEKAISNVLFQTVISFKTFLTKFAEFSKLLSYY